MKLFKVIVLAPLLFIYGGTSAQPGSGTRSAAMAFATVSVKDSWNRNPGAIDEVVSPLISMSTELKFNNSDISSTAVLLLLPVKRDLMALSFSQYGFSEYSEQSAAVSYSKKLSSKLSAGIQFNYYRLSVQKYGSASVLTAGAGAWYAFSPSIAFGASISNPAGSGFDPSGNDPLPVKISFGASYYFSSQVILCTQIEKQLAFPSEFRIGLEYEPGGWIALRTGVSVSPIQNYYGLGITKGHLHIDTAVAIHQGLGYSPQMSLSYAF